MRRIETIKSRDVLDLLERQDYVCPLTGRKLTPETASLDHIVPLARGGDHAIENVWIVDCQANAAKGTLLADEFIQLCRDVTAHQAATGAPQNGPERAVPSPEKVS